MLRPEPQSPASRSGIQSLRSSLGSCTADLLLSPGRGKVVPSDPAGSSPVAAPLKFDNILGRVEYALNAPAVHQRCLELSVLLEECPQKDLPTVFHILVDKIFGLTSGGRGWGLGNIQKSNHYKDFVALTDFLSSRGPLLKACYRLLGDPYLRYEFPLALLSGPTRQQLEAGGCVSLFLAGKLTTSHGAASTAMSLQLNSFEFYMFTFAAYIVQPYTPDNKFIPGESVYPNILEDYLSFFLPCDGTMPPSLPFPLAVSAAPVVEAARPVTPATPTRKSLLRQSAMTAVSPLRSPPTVVPTAMVATRSGHEVWRSETLVNTCAEFWLTPFSSPPPARGRHGSPSLEAATADLTFPVSDTLRIIRMTIKHLHYFSNSGGPTDVTPLDQLKRCVLPSLRPQIYSMFKYTFTHWPHDMSFRLVLETWLSYIQPWRYTDSGMRARGGDENNAVTVEANWQQFVAENILFYTTILKLLLPRFFRMDLTSSKNAYMLFRIAKIYSQIGLASLVKHGEAGLDRTITTSGGCYMPGILDYIEASDTVVTAARQCVTELEGVGPAALKYEPIFANAFRQNVSDLLVMATRARDAAQDSIEEQEKLKKAESSGLSWLIEQVTGTGTSLQDTSEVEDYRKSVSYLNQTISSLSQVFDLKEPDSSRSSGRRRILSGLSSISPGKPESCEVEGQQVLTPLGRWQLLQGLARPDIRYEGDPDLTPISHREIVWLVRLLYDVSRGFNSRYASELEEWYRAEGMLGEAARLILAPPTHYTTLERTLDGSPPRRRHAHHGPRLSLRIFANKQTLLYLILTLYLTSWLLGSGLFLAGLVLLILGGLLLLGVAAGRAIKRAAKGHHWISTANDSLNISKTE